ncbi:hypothetical protein B5F40_09180 [Gordonibacter sp. An230]|nr:hypothetical protein B5F40_09180 [Gordonibacter sp. An230]
MRAALAFGAAAAFASRALSKRFVSRSSPDAWSLAYRARHRLARGGVRRLSCPIGATPSLPEVSDAEGAARPREGLRADRSARCVLLAAGIVAMARGHAARDQDDAALRLLRIT